MTARTRRRALRRVTGGSVLLWVLLAAPALAPAATITPDTFVDEPGTDPDNGNCTLREAVISANLNSSEDACAAGGGADVIDLAAGTYTLSVAGGDSMPGSTEVDARFGDLDLGASASGALTIRGHAQGTTIDADDVDRVIDVFGGTATLRSLTLTGGRPTYNFGGGVRVQNGGVVRMFDSTISDSNSVGGGNAAGGGGAQVGVDSHLTLVRSSVIGNGGLHSGGLHVDPGAELVVRDSVIAENAAEEGPGGIHADSANVEVLRSTIEGNRAGSDGGGLRAVNSAVAVIDSRIIGNFTFRDGGGIYLLTGGAGGAVVRIQRSELSGNEANDDAGGLGYGGGAASLSLDVVNTTFSANVADFDDVDGGRGGGMLLLPLIGPGHVRIANATFAGNRARFGGGVLGGGGPGTLARISGTLVAGNNDTSGNASPDCRGEMISEGRNLFGKVFMDPAVCNFEPAPSDLIGVDPRLGPLADNGGPTLTHLLGKGSPAINAGPAAAPASDQRGAPRRRPDIGAYERRMCAGALVNVVGTNAADKLRGTAGRDGILGLGGRDAIRARAGNDAVCAGAGRDRVVGGAGRDKLYGEAGNDLLIGGGGRDLCAGGPGRDRARASCERTKRVP